MQQTQTDLNTLKEILQDIKSFTVIIDDEEQQDALIEAVADSLEIVEDIRQDLSNSLEVLEHAHSMAKFLSAREEGINPQDLAYHLVMDRYTYAKELLEELKYYVKGD